MTEIWKDISGFEGLYQVSNFGKVRSLERNIVFKDGRCVHVKEKILKPCTNKKGYLFVRLSKNNKGHEGKVHRLVAQAFIDNPKNKPQVDHIDGNKQNNNVNNLRWATNYENMHNPITFEKNKETFCTNGKKNGKPISVYKNGTLLNKFNSITDCEDFYGIKWMIGDYLNGYRKSKPLGLDFILS